MIDWLTLTEYVEKLELDAFETLFASFQDVDLFRMFIVLSNMIIGFEKFDENGTSKGMIIADTDGVEMADNEQTYVMIAKCAKRCFEVFTHLKQEIKNRTELDNVFKVRFTDSISELYIEFNQWQTDVLNSSKN